MPKSRKLGTLLGLLVVLSTFAAPFLAQASDPTTTLVSPLPDGPKTVQAGNLGGYINALFIYGLGLAALIALAQLIFGAVQYTASAGAPSLQEDAKSRMRGAIIGLILLILSTAILATLTGGSSLGLSEIETLVAKYNLQKYDEMSDEAFCEEINRLQTRKSNTNANIQSAIGNIRIQESKIANEIEPPYQRDLAEYTKKKAEYEGCVDLKANNPGVEGGDGSGRPSYCIVDGKILPYGIAYDKAMIAWAEKKLAQPSISESDKADAERSLDTAQRALRGTEEALKYLEDTFVDTKNSYEERLKNAQAVIAQSKAAIAANTASDNETGKLLKELDSRIRTRCK